MNVDVTALPGIGVRKDFEVKSGRRIGVVAHRDGDIDLIVSKLEDPDACAAQVALTTDEAAVLANLLGAPQLVSRLNDDHRDMPGITTRQLPISDESPYSGRTLGETQMRTRTKVSIVAVMRAGQLHPSPGPDFTFTVGDLLVVVGTPDGLDAAAKILTHG
ncbi:cation:proton antiporter regulatory subunit [Nocardia cyriacigeorgica]|uniref:cation:proton antiporter regulatory subunit n=1 Tax=Nocardia cyriacigeorgica TaxID=135487 RepID=UPI00030044E2|nr:cation:proton antiporter regulatory subunit [Nocardia cyriacigeorgica]MBF6158486.1 cation:proton antiporter regulatory subunit [Nocardia cyriacigeorgica]MBF6197826.1 cation:proton antiporter regulatory subunit [Nocardia cyriacigeorgica]MBF6316687.1 cation:proton antiporter regulatory subunit [Nocardia cyriacigeorgica]MBF6322571.1 cation:proton antiporter regulatory subunit [Nocardia cyriacigeorgica]MBF6415891.1 cation:proton antiporter regulatory subunit [Nocardia cyriacigeorgica]